jgi:hypothetical protein
MEISVQGDSSGTNALTRKIEIEFHRSFPSDFDHSVDGSLTHFKELVNRVTLTKNITQITENQNYIENENVSNRIRILKVLNFPIHTIHHII